MQADRQAAARPNVVRAHVSAVTADLRTRTKLRQYRVLNAA